MDLLLFSLGLSLGLFLGWFLFRRSATAPPVVEGMIPVSVHQQVQELVGQLQGQLGQAQAQLQELNHQLGAQEQIIDNLHSQNKLLEQRQQQQQQHFQQLAQQQLDEKSRLFAQENQQQIQQILSPFQQRLQEMEQRLHHFYTDESRQRAALGEQIRLLSELNQTMSLEAKQLTQALKGDNKVQGHWGELILERILESAGLAEGREYRLQHSQNTDEGQRLRPDCLLLLPQDRCVIVDAKVSLTAYERYVNQGQEAQDLREHLLSVRRHLNGLSGKNYPQLQGQKLDFVLLFIPIEAAFALAMQHEPSLFQEAFEKNVFIVSPTTLLVTARTVAYLWKQELMQSNVLEIARQGGLLYDSLAQALSEFDKVGDRLLKTQQQHQQLRHYLQSSLAQRAIKLQQLGAKTSKQLPGTWLANDEEPLNLFNHDQAL